MPRKAVLSIFATAALAVSFAGCGDDDAGQDDGADGGGADEAEGWVSITDEPSGARFSLPTAVEPLEDSAVVEDGSEVQLRNYSSIAMDGVVEVGFNIIDTDGAGYDLEAGVDGVANTLGGEVVWSVDTEVDGSPAVDVEMTYGTDKVVLFQLVNTDGHVMQTLVSGPEAERTAVEITYQRLNESLEVE